ncbi:MAG: cupin domain-containing protein [Nitriliruptorales bacterium]
MIRAAGGRSAESLRRCVGDVGAFLDATFGRRPHVHRAEDGFGDLLALADVDRILATMSLRHPAFRLVREGRPLDRRSYTRSGTIGGVRVHDLIDVGRAIALFEDGATIVLQGLHRYWEPVTRFCRDLEATLTHPVQANAYVTPPVATGLRVHHDTHDVFALQSHGSKRWVVHEPAVASPLADQHWEAGRHVAGEPTMELDLEPGDCLYLPRGTPHAAQTVDAPSIHLTIGIRAFTWHDVLGEAVAAAADEVAFRESLPVGFASAPDAFALEVARRLKEAATWFGEADARAIAERMAARFRSSRAPLLDGQLAEVLSLDDIDDATVVRCRPDAVLRLVVTDDRLTLELPDRKVTMPASVEEPVRRLLGGNPVAIDELDELDEESRRVLVRRLVREGALVRSRPA